MFHPNLNPPSYFPLQGLRSGASSFPSALHRGSAESVGHSPGRCHHHFAVVHLFRDYKGNRLLRRLRQFGDARELPHSAILPLIFRERVVLHSFRRVFFFDEEPRGFSLHGFHGLLLPSQLPLLLHHQLRRRLGSDVVFVVSSRSVSVERPRAIRDQNPSSSHLLPLRLFLLDLLDRVFGAFSSRILTSNSPRIHPIESCDAISKLGRRQRDKH